ncbi:MAG: hypothetical protein IPM37_08870 [Hahellaceae bacterium]|nr:hypothetical protein [Hahellaceae bacterium]
MPVKTHPLSTELFRQMAIVAAVPALITAVFFFFLILPRLEQIITSQQRSVAQIIASQTTQYIESAEEQIRLFSDLTLNDPSLTPRQSNLDAFVEQSPYFETLYLVDASGLIEMIGLREDGRPRRNLYLGLDLSKTTFLARSAQDQKQGWSDVFLSVVTGRLSIAYYLTQADQKIVAEIAIDRMPRLSQKFSEREFLVMLLDQTHAIVAHPDPAISQQQENLGNLPILADKEREAVTSGQFNWHGLDYFGTAIQMATPAWTVLVAQDQSLFSRPLSIILKIWLISMVITVLTAYFVSVSKSNDLSRRFEALNEQSARITAGDYTSAPYHEEVAEFQALSYNMRSMAEAIHRREISLQQSEQALRESNARLESRVQERTAELNHSNKELQETLRTLQKTMGQLIQSEKMAALGSLVAGVAHEMNTPIGNALMASSSLSDFASQLKSQLDAGNLRKSDLSQFLDDAIHSTLITARNLEKASELISSFKQVAVDQSSAQRREFKLAEAIEEILLTQKPVLKKHAVVVHAYIPPDIMMEGYPGALGQVLANLVANACMHAFVYQQDRRLWINATREDELIKLRFSDNGRGIPEADLKRIFDPFFTTRRGQGGSGLGLHIVHNLVTEALGGTITVESEPGKGTRFLLTLPLHSPVVARAA